MRTEFTGRHMAIILVTGFGIVIAVNLFMATLAVRGFGGVVVENSYVASQNFNGWLDKAREQAALGWTAKAARSPDGRIIVTTQGTPTGATVSADIRRPVGKPDHTTFDLTEVGPGQYQSPAPLENGRWIVRLTVEHGGQQWLQESHI